MLNSKASRRPAEGVADSSQRLKPASATVAAARPHQPPVARRNAAAAAEAVGGGADRDHGIQVAPARVVGRILDAKSVRGSAFGECESNGVRRRHGLRTAQIVVRHHIGVGGADGRCGGRGRLPVAVVGDARRAAVRHGQSTGQAREPFARCGDVAKAGAAGDATGRQHHRIAQPGGAVLEGGEVGPADQLGRHLAGGEVGFEDSPAGHRLPRERQTPPGAVNR